MEIDESKYFVLELGGGAARVASMRVYKTWVIANYDRQSSLHCPNITKEEARAFIKIMGFKDYTDRWESAHMMKL